MDDCSPFSRSFCASPICTSIQGGIRGHILGNRNRLQVIQINECNLFLAIHFNQALKLLVLVFQYDLITGLATTTTPPGCRKLNTDADWPSQEVWEESPPPWALSRPTEAMPEVRFLTTDCRLDHTSDVQNAVWFANEHNIRLTVLTTGPRQAGPVAMPDPGSSSTSRCSTPSRCWNPSLRLRRDRYLWSRIPR